MRIAICLMAAAVLLVGVPSSNAGEHGHGRRSSYPVYDRGLSGQVHVVFSSRDTQVIREYYRPVYRERYRPQYQRLPPGLQKKYYRTGSLPPGWQRRMQPFPIVVERQLIVLPQGYRRGVIDGNAVIYEPRRGVVIDATVVF